MRRTLALLTLPALVAAGAVATIGTAGAATAAPTGTAAPVTISGRTTGSLSAPGTVHLQYTVAITEQAVHDASFVADEPAGTVPDAASVRVQGAAPDAATVSVSGSTLTVNLGVGADDNSGGTLGVSAYLISFDLDLPSTPAPDASSAALLRHTDDGSTSDVTAAPVPITAPDLSMRLPQGSGELGVLPLGDGQTGDYVVEVRSLGASVQAATLTITLPGDLAVALSDDTVQRVDYFRAPDGGDTTLLHCASASASQVTCPVGAMPYRADILLVVPITTNAQSRFGQHPTFGLSIAPEDGVDDATPSDNGLSATLLLTGTAHLRVHMSASAKRVHLGHRTRLTVALTNEGPDPAIDAQVFAGPENDHFRLVLVDGKPIPTGNRGHLPRGSARTVQWSAVPADEPPPGVVVGGSAFGTVPAGQTRKVVLTFTAVSPGATAVDAFGGSNNGDPACENDGQTGVCQLAATYVLTALKPVKH